MNRNLVRGVLSLVGVAGLATAANAQAPASNQIWDVRFVVDRHAPASTDITTRVTITMLARVAITANSSASGTANFGVSRVGGANGSFFMVATDVSSVLGASSMGRALSSSGNDAGGNPLEGSFSPYRGGFSPQGSGGFNSDASNGIFSVIGGTQARVTSVVGTRSIGYDGNPEGVATGTAVSNLVGGYSPIFTVDYFPVLAQARSVSVAVSGLSARYLFADTRAQSPGTATAAPQVNLPNQTFSFRVPTPGAAAVLGLAGVAAFRRRRA